MNELYKRMDRNVDQNNIQIWMLGVVKEIFGIAINYGDELVKAVNIRKVKI